LGLPKLSYRQRDDLDRAKRYARDQSIRFVLNKQQISHQQNVSRFISIPSINYNKPFQQQKASQLTQALSLMARLYVGSVSFEIREENIKQMFSIFGPIKSLNMSYDSGTGVSILGFHNI
jgi:poly(U)-binding-splicing factor PUF60